MGIVLNLPSICPEQSPQAFFISSSSFCVTWKALGWMAERHKGREPCVRTAWVYPPVRGGPGFPGGSGVKNLPAIQETSVQSLVWEDSREKEMATHSCTLAWEIPWTEKPGGLQSMRVTKELDATERLNNNEERQQDDRSVRTLLATRERKPLLA